MFPASFRPGFVVPGPFAAPWPRYTVRDAILQHSGIDYMDYPDAASLEAIIRSKGEELAPNHDAPWMGAQRQASITWRP